MRDIGLNEEQSAKVRSILKETRINLIDARASLEKAEAEVEDIFNDDAVDIRKGNEAIERLVKARTDHGRAISQLSLRLRAVLSARQWRQVQDRRQQEPMRPGPNQPGQWRTPPPQPR